MEKQCPAHADVLLSHTPLLRTYVYLVKTKPSFITNY